MVDIRFLIVLVCIVATCDSSSQHPSGHFYLDKEAKGHAAAWSYEGKTGPEHWGELSPEYHWAKDGKSQSPIDIDTGLVQEMTLPKLQFHYTVESPVFFNNGHTVQHDDDGTSKLDIGGKHYRLEQFHVHTPSEHTINGRHMPLEIHLVHKAADREIIVVAVMVKEGKTSKAFHLLAGEHLPQKTGEKATLADPIDLRALIPEDHSYYTYRGSFTTPPCTEGVRWYLLKQPGEASTNLLRELTDILEHNNRPIQALNGRYIHG